MTGPSACPVWLQIASELKLHKPLPGITIQAMNSKPHAVALASCVDSVYRHQRQLRIVAGYSCLRASIGFSEAALEAGNIPNITPIRAEKPAAANTTHTGTLAGGKLGISAAILMPAP